MIFHLEITISTNSWVFIYMYAYISLFIYASPVSYFTLFHGTFLARSLTPEQVDTLRDQIQASIIHKDKPKLKKAIADAEPYGHPDLEPQIQRARPMLDALNIKDSKKISISNKFNLNVFIHYDIYHQLLINQGNSRLLIPYNPLLYTPDSL